MAASSSPATPNFPLADGFRPTLDPDALHTVNEVFASRHYASVPLTSESVRDYAPNRPYSERLFGDFACKGFVLYTLKDTAAETIMAPPPEMDDVTFLRYCLNLNAKVLPDVSFKNRMPSQSDVIAALGSTGVSVATGISISVKSSRPDVLIPSLILPLAYMSLEQQAVDPTRHAGETSAALLNLLATQHLKAMSE